jgi:O-antigen ligase/tetratricopeptide (TPR) repeat protein
MPSRSSRRRSATLSAPTSELLRSRLRLAGVALICAKVALVPLVFDPSSDAPFVVPKALLSHALAYVLAGVMLGLAIQFGRSLFVRSWLHVPVLAFLGVSVVATIFAADRITALYGEHARMVGLGTIADGVLLYFAIVLLVRTRAETIGVIGSGLGAAGVVLLYEFAQLASRDPFRWSVNGAIRPFSAIGQSTNLGLYLAVAVVAAAACALLAPRIARWLRASLLVLSVVALAGLVATQTRSGLLGLVTGFGLLLVLTFIGYPDRRARLISLAAAVGAIALLGVVLIFTPLGARVLTTVQFTPEPGTNAETDPRLEQSADVRLALYRVALDMVRERPLLGYGPDDFAVGLAKYRGENEPFEVQHGLTTSAHSWIAHVAAGSGVLGILSFVGIAGYALWLTVRTGFRPVAWIGAGILAAWLGSALTSVNAVSTDWLFWVGVAAIGAATGVAASEDVAAQGSSRARASGPVRGRRSSRGYLPVAVAAVGVVLALTTFTAFDASRSAQGSEIRRLASRASEAIDLGIRATNADPQRAEYWHTLGLAYIQADKLKEGASAFNEAIRLAPYDIRHLGDLARAYVLLARAGDTSMVARARDVAERAVLADPNNPQAHVTRAVVMQGTGNLPEALVSIDRALELEPISSLVEVYRTATQVLLGLGRKDEAIAMARRGVRDLVIPGDAALIRIELARALSANGQLTEALAELDLVLAVRPGDATATQLKAQIRASMPPQ